MVAYLWKWLVCSWAHRRHRCYPTVWGPKEAADMDIPYRPKRWHCTRCHPCWESLEEAIAETKVQDLGGSMIGWSVLSPKVEVKHERQE